MGLAHFIFDFLYGSGQMVYGGYVASKCRIATQSIKVSIEWVVPIVTRDRTFFQSQPRRPLSATEISRLARSGNDATFSRTAPAPRCHSPHPLAMVE
jgi:hypothetical protein